MFRVAVKLDLREVRELKIMSAVEVAQKTGKDMVIETVEVALVDFGLVIDSCSVT